MFLVEILSSTLHKELCIKLKGFSQFIAHRTWSLFSEVSICSKPTNLSIKQVPQGDKDNPLR